MKTFLLARGCTIASFWHGGKMLLSVLQFRKKKKSLVGTSRCSPAERNLEMDSRERRRTHKGPFLARTG